MGLVCHDVCGSMRKLVFRSLSSLGTTVLGSLSRFGSQGVSKHNRSEGRLFVRVRGSCLRPLPALHCRVERHGATAIVHGDCMALGGRRCDIPVRCVNGQIRVVCSTSALRVFCKVGLVAARAESSEPRTCAHGRSRGLPKERNDCRGSLSRVCRHTTAVSGVILACLGRITRLGGCPPLTFETYGNVVSLRGGCNLSHLITTYTYTSRKHHCNFGRMGRVLSGKRSVSFLSPRRNRR